MSNVVDLTGKLLAEDEGKFIKVLEGALGHAKSNTLRAMSIVMVDHSGTEYRWATDNQTSYYELVGALHVAINTIIKVQS